MTKPTEKDEEKKTPPKKVKEDLHRAGDTLGEPSGGGPNATERSRLAD